MAVVRSPESVLDLAGAEYVLLTTYTSDGRAKPTPVWAARDGDALVVMTGHDAWKVRRVRNTPRVTLSACTAGGDPRGASVDGVAVAVEGEHVRRVTRAVRAKYGWKATVAEALTAVGARLGRRGAARDGIVIRDA